MSEAIEDLIVREIPYLRRFARVLAKSDVDLADDVVQSCLERAIAKRWSFQPNTNLRAWLFTILHNVFIDAVRKEARRGLHVVNDGAIELLATPPSQEDTVELGELAGAVAQLPADQRATLSLVVVEGCTYEETAEIMNVPLGTLRSRLSGARASLRQQMNGVIFDVAREKANDGGEAA